MSSVDGTRTLAAAPTFVYLVCVTYARCHWAFATEIPTFMSSNSKAECRNFGRSGRPGNSLIDLATSRADNYRQNAVVSRNWATKKRTRENTHDPISFSANASPLQNTLKIFYRRKNAASSRGGRGPRRVLLTYVQGETAAGGARIRTENSRTELSIFEHFAACFLSPRRLLLEGAIDESEL